MPSWKKVIVSGSDATLNSLVVNSGVTGSLQGTASWAVSASQAVSSSYAPTATNVFIQDGNSFGAQATLGTNDTQNLAFETSGSTRMFISSSGLVGIGTTTPVSTLDVNGTGRFTSIIETSSLRYKKSIKTLPSQLETINALRPVTFKWKDKKKGEDTQYGLIAEELQQIMPEAVSLNSEGEAEAISYTKLVPILIRAVQELQAKVEKLEKQKK